MKPIQTGSGLTLIRVDEGIILIQPLAQILTSVSGPIWTLPEGNWWMVNTVNVQWSLAGNLAPVDLFLIANLGNQSHWTVGPAGVVTPTAFNGSVTAGRGMSNIMGPTQNLINLTLPEMLLPGGSTVSLLSSFAGFAGSWSFPVLTAFSPRPRS